MKSILLNIIIITFLFLACTKKNERFKFDESSYNVTYIETSSSNYIMTRSSIKSHWNQFLECYFMYSKLNEDHFFLNNDIEISFLREGAKRISFRVIIGIRYINHEKKAFFIAWDNGYPVESNPSTWKESLWNINEKTKIILTNVQTNVIQNIYPKYTGKIINIKLDSIVVDFSKPIEFYSLSTIPKYFDNFYNRIYFHGCDDLNFTPNKIKEMNIDTKSN
jgi:hypothetical protein